MIKRNTGFIRVVSFVCAFATAFSMLIPSELMTAEAAGLENTDGAVTEKSVSNSVSPADPVYKAVVEKQVLPTGDFDVPESHKINTKKSEEVDEEFVFGSSSRVVSPAINNTGDPQIDEVFTKSASKNGYNAIQNNEKQKTIYERIDQAATSFMNAEEDLGTTEYYYDKVGKVNEYVVGKIKFDDISGTLKDAIIARTAYDYDHPAYYWMANNFAYDSTSISIFTTKEYSIVTRRTAINNQVIAGIKKYAAVADSETDNIEKVRRLHDEICSDVIYAYNSNGKAEEEKWAHSVVGVFDKNYSAVVCEGYADTFSAVLNYMGNSNDEIKNYYIVGLGDGGAHAWNAFSVDGGTNYLYADLTWDDRKPSDGGGFSYEFFGMPKTTFEIRHEAYTPNSYNTNEATWLYNLPGNISDIINNLYYMSGGLFYGSSSTQSVQEIASAIKEKASAWPNLAVLADSTENLLTLLKEIKGSSIGNISVNPIQYKGASYFGYIITDRSIPRYTKPITGFEIEKTTDQVNINQKKYNLDINTITPDEFDDQIFIASSNTDVAVIDNPYVGKDDTKKISVTLCSVGTTIITLKSTGGVTKMLTLTVLDKPVPKVQILPTLTGVYGTAIKDLIPTGGVATIDGTWAVENSEDTTILHVENPGTARVIFTPTDTENYGTVTVDAQIVLEKRELKITVDNQEMEERSAVPEFTYTIDETQNENGGLIESDKSRSNDEIKALLGVTFTCIDNEGNAVDQNSHVDDGQSTKSFTITASSSNTDYDVQATAGTLTLSKFTKKTPTITKLPSKISGLYGTKVNDLDVSQDGIAEYNGIPVSGEWFLENTEQNNIVPKVGTSVKLKVHFKPDDQEYYESIVAGEDQAITPIIEPLPVSVTIENQELVKGTNDLNPTWKLTSSTSEELKSAIDPLVNVSVYNGPTLVPNESIKDLDVGVYTLKGEKKTASGSANYDITFINGSLNVITKQLTVTAESLKAAKLTGYYGTAVKSLDKSTVDALVVKSGDEEISGTWAIKDAAIGEKTTFPVGTTAKIDFVFTPGTQEHPVENPQQYGELTVSIPMDLNKVSITVTADEQTWMENTPKPKLTISLSADQEAQLKNGNTKDDLGVVLKIEGVTTSSGYDNYPKEFPGAIVKDYVTNQNYEVEVTPGKLTLVEYTREVPVIKEKPQVAGEYGDKISKFRIKGGQVFSENKQIVVYGEWTITGIVTIDESENEVINPLPDENGEGYDYLGVNTKTKLQLTFAPYYNTEYKNATCTVEPTISPKPISINITDQPINWGEDKPDLLVTAGKWTLSDDSTLASGTDLDNGVIKLSWSAELKDVEKPGAGTYENAIQGECANKNYEVTWTYGSLIVAPAETVIDNKKIEINGVYGDTIADLQTKLMAAQNPQQGESPAFDVKVYKKTSNGVHEETPVPGKWSIVTGQGVSDTTILKPDTKQQLTLHFEADSNPDCYNVADITGVVPSIAKKRVTITIDDYVREQRSPNPSEFTFTPEPNALVDGDTISDLGVSISCPENATQLNCAAGMYPLTATISDTTNYVVAITNRSEKILAEKTIEETNEKLPDENKINLSINNVDYNNVAAVQEIPKNAGILVVTGFKRRIPKKVSTPSITIPYGTTLGELGKFVKGGEYVDPRDNTTVVKGSWKIIGVIQDGVTKPIGQINDEANDQETQNIDKIPSATESVEVEVVFYPSDKINYDDDDTNDDSKSARTEYVPVVIERKKITLSIADATAKKGDPMPDFTIAPTPTQLSKLVGDDATKDAATLMEELDIELQTNAYDTSVSGEYRIYGTADDENYDITLTEATLYIERLPQIPVTITTAPTLSGEYGTTVSDLQLSEGVAKAVTLDDQGKPVIGADGNPVTGKTLGGTWALKQESTAIPHVKGTKAYTVLFTPTDNETYDTAEFDVIPDLTPRACSITADSLRRMQGKDNPTLTYTAEGLLDADRNSISLKLTTTATKTSNVGEYPITVTASSDDYVFTFYNGTLEVTKKEIKVTTVDQQPILTGYYGDTASKLTISGGRVTADDGIVPGKWTIIDSAADSLTVGTTRTVAMRFTPTESDFYDGVTANVTPIISKRPVTVSIDSKTMKQGAALPAFTWYISAGTLASWDTQDALGVTVTSNATSTSPNGTYTISGSCKTDNYAVTFKTGTLTISTTGTTGSNTTNGTTTGGGTSGGSGTTGGTGGITSGTTGNTGNTTDQGQTFAGVYFDGSVTTHTSTTGGVTTTTREFDDNSGNISMEAVTKSDSTGTHSEVDVYYPAIGLNNVRVVITKNTLDQARALSSTDNSEITLHVDAAGGREVALSFNYNDDTKATAYVFEKNGNDYVMTTKKTTISALSGGGGVLLPAGEYKLMTGAEAAAVNNSIVASVSTSKTKVSVKAGKASKVSIQGAGKSSVRSVSYSTSNSKVAKVSSTGKISGVKKGTATVTAKITFKNGTVKRVKVKISVSK